MTNAWKRIINDDCIYLSIDFYKLVYYLNKHNLNIGNTICFYPTNIDNCFIFLSSKSKLSIIFVIINKMLKKRNSISVDTLGESHGEAIVA